MWGWHYGDWMPWGALVMSGLMIAFWVLVILAIVWLIRQSSSRPSQPTAPPLSEARAILDRRFAAGEIDEQEYRSRRAVLDEGPSP